MHVQLEVSQVRSTRKRWPASAGSANSAQVRGMSREASGTRPPYARRTRDGPPHAAAATVWRMRLGVVDVGSNTVHLLVVDAHPGAQPLPASKHKIELRLAEHVADGGRIADEGRDRLADFVAECLAVAEDQGVEDLRAFVTSAIREAPNGERGPRPRRRAHRRPARRAHRRGGGPAHLPRRAPLVRLVRGPAARRRHRRRLASRSRSASTRSPTSRSRCRSAPAGSPATCSRATRPRPTTSARLAARARDDRRRAAPARQGRHPRPRRRHVARRCARSLGSCGAAPQLGGACTRRRLLPRGRLLERLPEIAAMTTRERAALPGVSASRARQLLAGAHRRRRDDGPARARAAGDLPVGAARGHPPAPPRPDGVSVPAAARGRRRRRDGVATRVRSRRASVYPRGLRLGVRHGGAAGVRRRRGDGLDRPADAARQVPCAGSPSTTASRSLSVHAPTPARHPARVGHRPLAEGRPLRRARPASSGPTRSSSTRRSAGSASTPGVRRRGRRCASDDSGITARRREHVPVAGGAAARGRGLPAALGPRSRSPTTTSRSTCRTPPPPDRTRWRWRAARHRGSPTCTSPTAPASPRDEHLVPGRGGQPCGEVLETLAGAGYRGHVVVEVRRGGRTRRSASSTSPRRSRSRGCTSRPSPPDAHRGRGAAARPAVLDIHARRCQGRTMPSDAIVVEDLRVVRGGREVLPGLSLRVPQGEVVGLLGPSGGGQVDPDALRRRRPGRRRRHRHGSRRAGRLARPAPPRRLPHPGAERLRRPHACATTSATSAAVLGAAPRPSTGPSRPSTSRTTPSARVDALSGGQLSRASLACTLVGDPEVLVLDEPTVGLDPVLRRDLWEIFRDLARRRTHAPRLEPRHGRGHPLRPADPAAGGAHPQRLHAPRAARPHRRRRRRTGLPLPRRRGRRGGR